MDAVSALKVVVAVTIRDNQVLMVRKRAPKGQLSPWMFPGGKVEHGESEEDAVVREFREETGLECLPVQRLGARTHPVSQQELIYWGCAFRGGKIAKEDEITYVAWVDIDDVAHLISGSLFQNVQGFLQQQDAH